MQNKVLLFFTILFSTLTSAQGIKKESLFQGSFNDKVIQMYIQSFEQECTGVIYYKSMVRYLDHKIDETIWRKFQIFANDNNGYILIDDTWHTGRYNNYIFITQDGANLNGFIKNEKIKEKAIHLEKVLNIDDFSKHRKRMEEFDDMDDC